MKKIFLIFTLFCSINLLSQNIEWKKNYGGSSYDSLSIIKQTNDGGFILGGTSSSNDNDVGDNNGSSDYWIVKTDQVGTLEWEQNFGGSSIDGLTSVQQTSDGGYILGGGSASTDGDVTGNNGSSDYWVVKTNQFGTLEWEENFGGSNWDFLTSLQQTNDGGYILGGYTDSSDGDVGGNNGFRDYWIVKINQSGTIEWEENFGGSSFDELISIQQASDGGYILGGTTYSNNGDVGGSNGSSDYWVVKTNQFGTIEWEKSFGGSNGEFFRSLQKTNDGGYILGGGSASTDGDVGGNNGSYDYWIIKINQSGTIEWEQNFGGSSEDVLTSVEQISGGGFILGGYSFSSNGDVGGNNGSGDYWIIKTNQFGTLEWEQNFGGSSFDEFMSIQQTNDGNFILGGTSFSNDGDVVNNNGLDDYCILKVSNNFNPVTACNTKVQVTAETGDIYVDNTCYGLILTAPDSSCYRIKIQIGGTITTESVICP